MGPYKLYDVNKILRVEGFYLDGDIRDGLFTYYDQYGHLLMSVSYSKGKKNGPTMIYYPQDKNSTSSPIIECILDYNNDSLQVYEEFDKNNTKRSYQQIKSNKNHGKYNTWYEDGSYEIDGYFYEGHPDGEWMIHIKNCVEPFQTKYTFRKRCDDN